MMCFKYGMKYRGFSPGCQPMDGIIGVKSGNDKYWSIIYYDRKLHDREVSNYELDYLGEVPSEEFMDIKKELK